MTSNGGLRASSALLLVACSVLAFATDGLGTMVPVLLRGTNFNGGAGKVYGSRFYGKENLNYVYAQATGTNSEMYAHFVIQTLPGEPLFLHLTARDDDAPGACRVRIAFNGQVLMEGPSGFPGDGWKTHKLEIPRGVLKTGTNEIAISNQEREGRLGQPPWFMIASAMIAPDQFDPATLLPPITANFLVRLPSEKRDFPEPLSGSHVEPGFKIRGTKGWGWAPDQYLSEIPVVATCRMNFLMNCYLTLYTGSDNQWWKPLPTPLRQGLEKVVRACREKGLQFCFAVNPNLGSSRPLDYANEADVESLWQHFAWMQGLGVRWFSISLDDISTGIDAAGQARVVNRIFERLRQADSQAQMIFCPTHYWGIGKESDGKADPYLTTLATELNREVFMFWTGPEVCPRTITKAQAEQYRSAVGHRIILWDNYPVNDRNPALHLGPLTGRATNLCEVLDGYMSNPLAQQNEINRIPLMTCADYAWNPWDYEPGRSVAQAILRQGETGRQRKVLKELVEMYPGFIIEAGEGYGPAQNQVLNRFKEILARRNWRPVADAYLRHFETVRTELARGFPSRYAATKQTLSENQATMAGWYEDTYGETPNLK